MDSQVISKRQLARRRLSRAKLDEMIEEATVDAYGREEMLAVARRTATPDQRKALAEVQGA